MESIDEIQKRFSKCEKTIKKIRGTFITSKIAKKINKLQKGGFKISETRLDDNNSLVVMERQIDNLNFKKAHFFIVKGKLGKKLHFN